MFLPERKLNWESGNWISSLLWCVEVKGAMFSFPCLGLKRQLEPENTAEINTVIEYDNYAQVEDKGVF
jgi:hypothetical protein